MLRQFARRPRAAERCELCSLEIASEHPHLIEPVARKLVCSCDACALLFSGRADARFKRVPRQVRLLANFQIVRCPVGQSDDSDQHGILFPQQPGGNGWSPCIPVRLARRSRCSRWRPGVRSRRRIQQIEKMESDVEALLVNRIGHARGFTGAEYYVLPIDQCFKLVGLIRSQWRGFSGGTEVWQKIAEFFAELRANAVVIGGQGNA